MKISLITLFYNYNEIIKITIIFAKNVQVSIDIRFHGKKTNYN
jgi:hypothetical protein